MTTRFHPNPGPRPASLSLAKDDNLTLSDVRGASIRCRDGGLWITQDRDVRDIVLTPGETFVFDRDGPALVSALIGSSLELRSPTRVRSARQAA